MDLHSCSTPDGQNTDQQDKSVSGVVLKDGVGEAAWRRWFLVLLFFYTRDERVIGVLDLNSNPVDDVVRASRSRLHYNNIRVYIIILYLSTLRKLLLDFRFDRNHSHNNNNNMYSWKKKHDIPTIRSIDGLQISRVRVAPDEYFINGQRHRRRLL